MKTPFCFVFITTAILLPGCTKGPVTPGNPSFTVSGSVLAYQCYPSTFDSCNFAECTGKQALITLERADHLTFATKSDKSSNFLLRVDTGTYSITLESIYAPPRIVDSIVVKRDTFGIPLWAQLFYNPPDTLIAVFSYGHDRQAVSEAKEDKCLYFLYRNIPGLNLSLIRRTVYYFSELDVTDVEYDGIAIENDYLGWRVVQQADSLAQVFPDSIPAGFSIDGYPHACQDAAPSAEEKVER